MPHEVVQLYIIFQNCILPSIAPKMNFGCIQLMPLKFDMDMSVVVCRELPIDCKVFRP